MGRVGASVEPVWEWWGAVGGECACGITVGVVEPVGGWNNPTHIGGLMRGVASSGKGGQPSGRGMEGRFTTKHYT